MYHQLNYYWDLGWTCPVCVLEYMTVCVGGGREKLCGCAMVVFRCGYVCGCLLLLPNKLGELFFRWDCRLSICILWAMAFSSLHLTWLSASSSLSWASSLTIWRSLWCCMLKFCLFHPVLILCLSSNSAFNFFNSKVEGGILGLDVRAMIWLAGVTVWAFNCWPLVVKRWTTTGDVACPPGPDLWWSKPELSIFHKVGAVCADCIILILELKVLMAASSKFGLMLGSAIMSLTIVWLGHINCSLHYGSKGVEVECFFINCSVIVGPSLSRGVSLGQILFPVHLLFHNSIGLMESTWLTKVWSRGVGLPFPSSQKFLSLDVWKYNL